MPRKYTPEQAVAAFWSKVDQSGGPDHCWPWKASCNQDGYGHVGWRGRLTRATHVMYELTHGELPKGLQVLHTCDNPVCVNPAHLFLGTPAINGADKKAKGRARGAKGERNSHAKLTNAQREEVRRLYAADHLLTPELAEMFGISVSSICEIVRDIRQPDAPGRKERFAQTRRGERNGRAKITQAIADEIRTRYRAGGISQQSLGDEYGIVQTVVSLIVCDKLWRVS